MLLKGKAGHRHMYGIYNTGIQATLETMLSCLQPSQNILHHHSATITGYNIMHWVDALYVYLAS